MGPKVLFSVRTAARSRAMHASMSNCLIAARPRALRRAPLTLMHLPRASAVATGLDGASAPQAASTAHISPQGGFTGLATALMRAAPRMRQRVGPAEGRGGLAEEETSFE